MKISTRITQAGFAESPAAKASTACNKQYNTSLKRWLSVSFLLMMIAFSQLSFGQLLTQDFDYTGTLSTNGWAIHSGAATNPISTTTGLSYTGALGSGVGNAALVSNLSGQDLNITFTNQTGNGTSVYYSCMINVNDPAATKTGDYLLHIGTPGGVTFTNFAARIFARITASGVNFGISNTSTAAYGTTNFAKNTTYLLIVKYTINTGGVDNASLWIVSSGVPASEGAAGTPELTTATTGTDAINTIALRQGSASTSPQTVVDGIRVGTTWADVTVGAAAPVINSSLAVNATVGVPFNYTITALNNPSSFSSSSLPVNGLSLAGAVISGTPTTATAPGTQDVNITATNGLGADNKVLAITVNKGTQTITGFPLTDTKTFGDAAYNLTATGGASGNPVTYSASPAGVVTIAGNLVTIVGAGVTTITASQAGNANYNAAADVPQTLTVNQATQTITFGGLAPKPDNGANFQLTATGGGSGNPIVYTSSNTAVAIIVNSLGNPDPNGDYVDILTAGSTIITANQAGNSNYLDATAVQQTQVINSTSLLPQTITGLPLTDTRTYGDANYQLTATGGLSGNPVTYQSLNTSVATIVDNLGNLDPNGTYVKIISNGTATIRASQAGNLTYNPAPDVDQVLTVNQKEITITGAVANDKPYDGTDAAVITGYTVNGVLGGDDVTISGGGTFASVNAGTWTVTAALIKSGADQSKYSLTQPSGLSATISQLTQTITGLLLTDTKTFGAAPYNLTATGGASGNPVTYSASPAGVVTIAGNVVTIVGAGVTTITASQAGNTNYSAATDVPQTLTVNQANQTITFAAIPTKTTADAPFNLTGTASSGLTVSYSSSNPAVADVVGNVVTIYTTGTTIITATQAGNANYLPATNVLRTLNVTAPLIAAWDFTGPGNVATFAATIFNANLSSSNLITRGAGAAASVGANSFRTIGFQNNGISTANTDYFETTLSAASGKTLNISDITAKFNGTGTYYAGAGVTSQFAYSLDGTNFTLIGSPVSITSANLQSSAPIDVSGISALQNVPSGTTVTIRYYASGQTGTGGWGFFSSAVGDYGLTFGGSISTLPPTATYTKTNVSACNNTTSDGTITVTAAGGTPPYNYTWTGMVGVGNANLTPFTSGVNAPTITGLTYGFYNVTITDANLSTFTITGIHIESAYTVFVTNNGSISSSCGNPAGSILLYGNAGIRPYTYSLDGITYQPSNTFTNLAAGTYTGYVKDAGGCVGTKPNIVIGTAAPLVVLPYVRQASSCNADGVIEIYRTGGIGPYTYSLDNITYQSNNIYPGLAAGPYTAYVKDSKDCVSSVAVTVTQGAALTVTANKSNASTCIPDGSIQVNVSGGVYPYQYSIDGGNSYQSGNLFTGLAANTYVVTVKDFKNCMGTVNVTINNNIITVSAYTTAASSCGSSNGTIQLFRTGGVGPFTYSMNGNDYQAGNLFTGLVPGYYEGYVKDSKTCVGQLIDIYVGPDCGQRQAPTVKDSKIKANQLASQETSILKLSVYPNPTSSEFILNLEGYGTGKTAVIVTDIMGRKVYQSEGNANVQYRFGKNFKAGMYNVQVIQGSDRKSIWLVKE